MLGSGNEDAARTALQEWKGGLQVGGGITDKNAASWIDSGAEKVLGLVSLLIKLHILLGKRKKFFLFSSRSV
jgi:phosphoribosylformimino-5-aminoimidazole carboxamide ribonucleotide (ProFAR) isomerase